MNQLLWMHHTFKKIRVCKSTEAINLTKASVFWLLNSSLLSFTLLDFGGSGSYWLSLSKCIYDISAVYQLPKRFGWNEWELLPLLSHISWPFLCRLLRRGSESFMAIAVVNCDEPVLKVFWAPSSVWNSGRYQ